MPEPRHGGLARPEVTAAEAAEVAARRWGLVGEVRELGSQQDRNYLIATSDGARVLKFANAETRRAELEAQSAALERLALAGLRVPATVPSLSGADVESVDVAGGTLLVRVLEYVEGATLLESGGFGADDARLIGDTAGRIAAALSDFAHPGTERVSQWDSRAAAAVVDELLPHVSDAGQRAAIASAREAAARRLEAVAPELPVQVIHADVTGDNVVRTPGGDAGVIDFGDLQQGWRVAELAAACAGILIEDAADLCGLMLETVSAFSARLRLTDAELTALWPLVVLRTAVLVVSSAEQRELDGDNDYAEARAAAEWRSFRRASGWDADELEALISAAARGAGDSARASVELRRMLPAALTPTPVDLSVLSPELDAGAWLEAGTEERILRAAAGRSGAATTRWGEYRLTRARPRAPRGSAKTLATGVELVLPAGTELSAPFAGSVHTEDGGLALHGEQVSLRLEGAAAAADGPVEAGARLAVAAGGSDERHLAIVRVQLATVPGIHPPFFVTPLADAAWRRICPDPSALLGVDAAVAAPDADALLARRDASFAPVQEHYYARPPQIERGWREHLIDTTAQVYVDGVNNVATLGHSHPRLVEAAARQWALLNTNSRFHYAAATELSERLAELAPAGLDAVFLVNSGSEAVDLALRLAFTATGRSRILAAREAYHGWTIGSDAVSTSLGDNPRALESRPDWVELIEAPNPLRGRHRGPDAGAAYLADLDAQLEGLGAEGRAALAGVILEPIFGNGGGVLLPDGYLAGVYDRVRALGGVCIADEVQLGYGRLGRHFWGFEQQGAVPDIITVAKAMGNGQPLGAVITTQEIAAAFAAEGSFFSSAGGSPVSSRIGLAVLDVLREEGLQENARLVGEAFKAALEGLATRHPSIGAVHGLGLYLGVELVTDRASFEPATRLADAVCEALLEEGCVVQPTGDHKNVLKLKPPLCITAESARFVTGCLDRVLTELGA
ncbi:aminotransferase [Gryllotalpicola koreensis]|uniref:Aminotransferase n=1 Tax=Gryllotalpicola koreensis TaxID=993086 RepID=A0ABP7ZTQ7_9MICO